MACRTQVGTTGIAELAAADDPTWFFDEQHPSLKADSDYVELMWKYAGCLALTSLVITSHTGSVSVL
jgi:hypothetical protein